MPDPLIGQDELRTPTRIDLLNGGEMRSRIQAFDWSRTPLGPAATWPQALKFAVEIMLASRFPMLVWWGADRIQLYNDACIPVLGERHPFALGQPAPQCWTEAWPFVGKLADAVMAEGCSTLGERLETVTIRNGRPEETYLTLSFSPVLDEGDAVAGLFCTCVEETPRVLGDRRVAALAALGERTAAAKTTAQACEAAVEVLAGIPRDLPFLLLYALDADQHTVRLAGSSGVTTAASAETSFTLGETEPWPFSEVLARTAPITTGIPATNADGGYASPWPEAPRHAVVLPLARLGGGGLSGFLVGGISPRLPLDDAYRTFLGLVARQVAATLASVHACAREREQREREQPARVAPDGELAKMRAQLDASRASERRYATLFDAIDEGFYIAEAIFDADGRCADILYRDENPAAVKITGTSRKGHRLSDMAGYQPCWCDIFGAVARTGEPQRLERYADPEGKWYDFTVFKPDGEAPNRVAIVFRDITERKRVRDPLVADEERLRQFGEASQDVLWIRDAKTLQWQYLTPAFETIYGVSRETALRGDNYRSWIDLILPEDRSKAVDSIARVRAGEHVTFDYRVRRPSDGAVRWLRNTDFPIVDASGEIVLIGSIGHDETGFKLAQERQDVLLAELQHRVRNILAVTRAIISRSDDGERSTEEYIQHLQGRIGALARTQILLTRTAGSRIDLEDLIRDELMAQAASDDQVRLDGENVRLSPKTAEVLTLAVHELATNATKYGAFARPSGRLDVRWHVEARDGRDWLVLGWAERGVPIVDAVPRRHGFGAELILRRIPYELKGHGSLELKPGGVESRIEFPLAEGESILQTDAGQR